MYAREFAYPSRKRPIQLKRLACYDQGLNVHRAGIGQNRG